MSKLALGLNARNYLFIRPLNFRKAKQRADNKLLTKERLLKRKVPTPDLITVFKSLREVRAFDWAGLPKSFVLKPARGYGGEGIITVRSWDGAKGKRANGTEIDVKGLEAEIFSILDGAYSLSNLPDTAFLEERVIVSGTLRKLSKKGVPDIRVIVCNQVPVMAMLRLPTEYSHGKANLHQGALGIGIDLRTGITTHGVFYGDIIKLFPGTREKIRGIKIPQWDEVLRVAVRAQVASHLGYAGIDVVLDKSKGPLVLEVNARPGLQIQLANGESLRTRLERVADMKIPSMQFGIDLGKKIFAEHALAEIPEDKQILGVFEKVTVYGPKGRKVVVAKIDTGAYRTSIDESLIEELGLKQNERMVRVKSGSIEGEAQERPTVDVRLRLKGVAMDVLASFVPREHMRYPVIIGRRSLAGFLVDPRDVEKPE